MANKLAGQRAKFSRAKSIYYTTSDPIQKERAAYLMAEVIFQAPLFGFTEEEVTQGEDVPRRVREIVEELPPEPAPIPDDDGENYELSLHQSVDTADCVFLGEGEEAVYAYTYGCTPDRIKVGSSTKDVVARVAAQVSTSTPDKPKLVLVIYTENCTLLERTIHGYFRLRNKEIAGGGAEWFLATKEEVIDAYEAVYPTA